MNQGEISEALFNSVQVLIDASLAKVKYDKTLKYKVIDDSKKSEGIYRVTDGDIEIDVKATSTTEEYKVDDQVYVTITQGDYAQDKVIVGRYVESETNKPITYIAPEDQLILDYEVSRNLSEKGLIADGSWISDEEQEIDYGQTIKACFIPFNDYTTNKYVENDYTRLVLGCEFLNNLGDYNIVSGNYGVIAGVITCSQAINVNNTQINLQGMNSVTSLQNLQTKITEINNANKGKDNKPQFGIKYITLDSSEMIGNIYNYSQSMPQDTIVDISALQNIVGVFIELYQMNNFKSQGLSEIVDLHEVYKNKYEISSLPLTDENHEFYKKEKGNISITKVWLKFGYSQQDMKDNTFNLYTQNSLTFLASGSLMEENIKNIKAKWIHKDEETGKLISINDLNTIEDYSNKYDVYWYISSYEVGDTHAGWGWTRIKPEDKGMAGLTQSTDPFDLVYAPVTDLSEISIKAVLLEKGENDNWEAKAQSSVLTFKNQDMGSNVSGVVYLEITDSQKDFLLYRQDYRIDLQENFNKTRTIKATIPDTRTYTNLEIEWIIPRGGSMILDPKLESSTSSATTHSHYLKYDTDMSKVTINDTNPSYYIITREFSKKSKEEELSENCFLQGFGINEFYNPTYNRNQIICRVYYDNNHNIYDEGRINLKFGQMGSNGTNYNFGFQYEGDPYITCYAKKDGKVWKYSYKEVVVTPFLTSDSINLTEEEVELALSSWTYEFQDQNTLGLNIAKRSNNSIAIKPSTDNADITQQMSNCLKATCTINDIKLYTYLPIAIRVEYQIKNQQTNKYEVLASPDAIQAPGVISYSSQGGKIEYSKAPLYLFGRLVDSGEIIGTQDKMLDLNNGPQGRCGWNIQEGLVDKCAVSFTGNLTEINQNDKLYSDLNSDYKGFLISTGITDKSGLVSGTTYTFTSSKKSGSNPYCTIELIYGSDDVFYLLNIKNITSNWGNFPPRSTVLYGKNDTYTTKFTHNGTEYTKSFVMDYGSDWTNCIQGPYFIVSNQDNLDEKFYSAQNFKDKNFNKTFKLKKCGKTQGSSVKPLYPGGGNQTKAWYKFIDNSQSNRCDKYIYYIELQQGYSREQLKTDINSSTKFISFAQDENEIKPGALSFEGLADKSYNYRVYLDSEALSFSQVNGNSKFLTFLKTSEDGKSYTKDSNYNIRKYIKNLLQANQTPRFIIRDQYESDTTVTNGITTYDCQIIPNETDEISNTVDKYIQQQGDRYFIDFYCTADLNAITGYIYFYNFYKGIHLKDAPDTSKLPVSWRIATQEDGAKVNTSTIEDKIGLPSIQSDSEQAADDTKVEYLQPYPLYIPNQRLYQLEASYTLADGQVYLLWLQPLLILQDFYANPILNQWDGSTNVTGEHILSPAIGAGSKNEYNEFSGVFMGKVKVDDSNALHGLYGYHNGAQVFGFTENGKGFIGKSGMGRINIDGDKSTIASAKYSEGTGIKLDLDAPLFNIKSDNKSLITFSNNSIKLQTSNYEEGETGALIDLKDGKIEINGDEEEGHRIIISNSGSTPFQILGNTTTQTYIDNDGKEQSRTIQKQFKVDWDGTATLDGAKITGNIEAGSVGGWIINSKGLGYTTSLAAKGKLSGNAYDGEWLKGKLEKGSAAVEFTKYKEIGVNNELILSDGEVIPSRGSLISMKILGLDEESELTEEGKTMRLASCFKEGGANFADVFFGKVLPDNYVRIRIKNMFMAIAQLIREKKKYKDFITLSIDSLVACYDLDLSLSNNKVETFLDKIATDYATSKNYLNESRAEIYALVEEIIGSKLNDETQKENLNEKILKNTEAILDEDVMSGLKESLNIDAESNKFKYNRMDWCDPDYFIEVILQLDDDIKRIETLNESIKFWNQMANSPNILNIGVQGNIKTQGYLILGGMSEGEKNWSLNPRSKDWVIKYGNNSNDYNKFFGVCLPDRNKTTFGRGIRYNYHKEGMTINYNGIRTYKWTKTTTSSGKEKYSWVSNFTLSYLRGGENHKSGIKCNNAEHSLWVYSNDQAAYLVRDQNDRETGCYLGLTPTSLYVSGYEKNKDGKNMKKLAINFTNGIITVYDQDNANASHSPVANYFLTKLAYIKNKGWCYNSKSHKEKGPYVAKGQAQPSLAQMIYLLYNAGKP